MNKLKGLIGLAACAFSTATFATGEGFYLGGQLGLTTINNQPKTLQTGNCISTSGGGVICGPTSTTPSISPSNSGYGGRLYVGYNLNKYFAMEMGFAHYGASTYKVGMPNPPIIGGNPISNPTVRTNAFDIVGKGTMQIWVVGAFLKLGIAMARQSSSGSLLTTYQPTPPPPQILVAAGTVNTVRPTGAVGINWDITPNWVADLTYSRIFGGSGFQSADMISLGVSYHFVDIYCGQFLC